MHVHVAREPVSERRRRCVTPLFNHLFAQFTCSPASQQLYFFFHLFIFFPPLQGSSEHTPPCRLSATLPRARLVAPEALTVFGLRQLIYFLEGTRVRLRAQGSISGEAQSEINQVCCTCEYQQALNLLFSLSGAPSVCSPEPR